METKFIELRSLIDELNARNAAAAARQYREENSLKELLQELNINESY